MLRLLFSIYATGIVVFFVLFLIFVPKIPLINAVVAALLWPWGVYRYFVATGALT
jgi:hypothetical protein